MHRISLILVVLISGSLFSCRKSAIVQDSYFDSLVVAQVKYLSAANPSVTKIAMINGKEAQATLVPDSALWAQELEAFRQLSLFERPSYRDAYRLTDGIRDSKSNLLIRQFQAVGEKVPISDLKFYYYKKASDLKKIEAVYQQGHPLFTTTRRLVLEFEDVKGKAVLSAYAIDGSQKMILSDTIRFFVHCKIAYSF